MEQYKPNSHKYKAEQKAAAEKEKKVEKVIKGKATVKKKSGMSKLSDVFISEDAHNVKNYVLMDVLIPTIKKAIVDIVTDGISMIFLGGTSRNRDSRSSRASFVSYDKQYDRRNERRHYDSRSAFDYDDIVLDSKAEAQEVLDRMDELIDRYGEVSVSDLYELVGARAPFTANKYGWTNLRSADSVRVMGGGYMLKLPRAILLD